jgi:hypothetical protein
MMNLERRWTVKRTRGGRKGYLAGHGTKPPKEGKKKEADTGGRGGELTMDVGRGALQDTTKRAHTVDLENAAGELVAVFCIIKPLCGPCRTSLDSFVSRVSPPPRRSILITYFLHFA